MLGYYPRTPLGDGKYRKIRVRVNRPGVTVLSRQGYYARVAPPVFDRRSFLTENRVVSAAIYRGAMRDIRVEARATEVASESGGGHDILVEVVIDPSRVSAVPAGGVHEGLLDVVVFFADARKTILDERWKQLDMKLPPHSYEQVMRGGIPCQVRVPKKPGMRVVKVVVYDYQADLLGSVEVVVK